MEEKSPVFAETIARQLSSESRSLSLRWLERLNDLLQVERDQIFPTNELLDFYRASPEMDAKLGIRGSGLGLAIVADCVKAIGGRISVASVQGEGTVFDLWLPPAMPSMPEERAAR